MAKKNWRDSGNESGNSGIKNAGRSDSTDRDSSGAAGKAVTLLLAAGLLGGLIAYLFQIIWPAVLTPVLFYESFPHSRGKAPLSTSAFKSETLALIGDEKNNGDLDLIEANLENPNDIKAVAGGPQKNVAFFYVYADLVANEEGIPFVITSGDATEASANRELLEFLRTACTLDLENGGEEPEEGNQRIVVLDTGRLDGPSFTTIMPQAIGTAVKSAVETLKNQKVPNTENLWVMLATDDYQLGWTAPELNSSVFGYFFSRGLKGDADADENRVVTLAELHDYVRDSTARWVQDYRDSVQTPILISGGDLENALSTELIYHHNVQSAVLTTFQTEGKIDPKLWQQGFQVQQPHRRQAICSKLVRLEQVRFCNSPEFTELTNQVTALLDDAQLRYRFKDRTKTSVFAALTFDELKTALGSGVVGDIKALLDPNSALTPAGRREAEAKAKAELEARKAAGKPPIEEIAESDSDEEATPAKPPSSRLQRLTPHQRLALVWHYLRHSRDNTIDVKKLKKLFAVIRYKADMRACNELVEMQFLDLLMNNLPWEEPGFDNSILFSAIASFDASQSLIEGTTTSHSQLDLEDVRLNDQDRSVFLSNWKHFDEAFEKLEHRRRIALDYAIAGQIENAKREFESVIKDYELANNNFADLYDARKRANDLLFVLPYVKSFSLRKSVYRNEVDESGESSTKFQPDLHTIAKLENLAKSISELTSGLPMSDEQFERLVELSQNANSQATAIKESIDQMAGQLAGKQSASKYAFEGQVLLGTPIPEWIDDGQGTKRAEIIERLDQLLSDHQSEFFQSERTDQESPLDVNQLVQDHRKAAEKKLETFANEQAACLPALSLATGLQKIQNWDALQLAVTNLPSLNDLKNRTPGTDDALIDDVSHLSEELLRLDEIDRKLRVSDPGIGLSKKLSDVSQQQSRLLLFDWERRKLNRAVRDFWGNGDVSMESDQVTPFLSRANQHAENLKALADSTKVFMLDDQDYRAYDPNSLTRFANNLSDYVNDTWDKVSNLKSAWIDNGKPLPTDTRTLVIPESASKQLGLGLTELDSVLSDESYFPATKEEIQNTFSRQLLGQRVQINEQGYFDELNVSDAVQNNSRAEGSVYFRGHWFKSDLWVVRQRTTIAPSPPYVFQPPHVQNDKSWISVINQENKMVDVMFLLDCSGSMSSKHRGRTRMALLKEATRDIILEFAKSERFYIGLAAFGHRVRILNPPQLKNGKFVIHDPDGTGAHPFSDWQTLFPLPEQPSDQASIEELFEQFPKLVPNGSTPLYYSMAKTLDAFPRTGRKRILIVVTDGEDAQIPPAVRDRQKAFPPGKGEADLTSLGQVKQKMSQSSVQVLVLRISSNFNSQLSLEHPHRVVSDLIGDFRTPMRNAIYDFIGRYKFSVLPLGQRVTANDQRDMGVRKVEITVPAPKSLFEVKAHGVSTPTAPRSVTLNGGEDYEFVYDKGQINHNDSKTRKIVQNFLPPMIKSPIPMATGPHKIGRLSNYMNNVVFGFASQRGISQPPVRIWARVTEVPTDDGKVREFDVTRSTRKFSGIPTFSFQMPDAIKSRNINMTLYVLSGEDKASNVREEDGKTNFIEHEGVGGGEFRGLKYNVNLKEGHQDRFIFEITSDSAIETAFHVECPNSRPIETSIDKKRVIHNVVFTGNKRSKETFEFEIPESKRATFKLYAQSKEKFEAAINDRPDQTVKKCTDPIFGDEVIAIQFNGIELKR